MPNKTPPLSADARRLVTVGTTLFGDRWQSPLARGMGVVPSALSMIAAGDRPMTEGLTVALRNFLTTHEAQLRQQLAFVMWMNKEMRDELSPEPNNDGPRFGL